MVNLGDLVKDKISGFTGICVAKTSWLYGCERVTLQPNKLDKEGKLIGNETFDEAGCVVVKTTKQTGISRGTFIAAPAGDRDDSVALRRN